MPWHCAVEGPWWKRWRIRLFGLTKKEWAENMDRLAEMRVSKFLDWIRRILSSEVKNPNYVQCGYADCPQCRDWRAMK